MISTFTAFFDANVFYGARLRSLLLFLAQTKLFRARWSDRAHDEWIGILLQNRPELKPTDRYNDPIGITIRGNNDPAWFLRTSTSPRVAGDAGA